MLVFQILILISLAGRGGRGGPMRGGRRGRGV